MAEEKKPDEGFSLSQTFKSVAKHLFSPWMIMMMVAMTLPAVSAAAATLGAKATLGDIGMATVDMFKTMVTAPFTDGGTVVEAFSNAAQGNIMPGSYEMGMMNHGGATAATHATATATTSHAAVTSTSSHVASMAPVIPDPAILDAANAYGADPNKLNDLMNAHPK